MDHICPSGFHSGKDTASPIHHVARQQVYPQSAATFFRPCDFGESGATWYELESRGDRERTSLPCLRAISSQAAYIAARLARWWSIETPPLLFSLVRQIQPRRWRRSVVAA